MQQQHDAQAQVIEPARVAHPGKSNQGAPVPRRLLQDPLHLLESVDAASRQEVRLGPALARGVSNGADDLRQSAAGWAMQVVLGFDESVQLLRGGRTRLDRNAPAARPCRRMAGSERSRRCPLGGPSRPTSGKAVPAGTTGGAAAASGPRGQLPMAASGPRCCSGRVLAVPRPDGEGRRSGGRSPADRARIGRRGSGRQKPR